MMGAVVDLKGKELQPDEPFIVVTVFADDVEIFQLPIDPDRNSIGLWPAEAQRETVLAALKQATTALETSRRR